MPTTDFRFATWSEPPRSRQVTSARDEIQKSGKPETLPLLDLILPAQRY